MTGSEQQILDMVSAGRITAAEGDQLLRAVRKRPALWKLAFNPFDTLATSSGLLIAGLLAIGAIAVSLLGVRFDGALDLHLVARRPSVVLAVFDTLNATLLTAIVFWVASKVVARQGRLVDFVVAVGVARAPYVATGLLLALISPDPGALLAGVREGLPDPRLLLGALLAIPALTWFVILLFTGFKTASGLRGVKLGASFVGALLSAELATKAVLTLATGL